MNKKKSKLRGLIIAVGSVILAVLVIFGTYFFQKMSMKVSTDVTKEELQAIVNETVAKLPNGSCKGSVYVAENTSVIIDSFSYGTDKDIVLDCTYTTLDLKGSLLPETDEIVAYAYDLYATSSEALCSEVLIMAKSSKMFSALLEALPKVSGNVTITLYETEPDFEPWEDGEDDYSLVRTKEVFLRPMDLDEAIMQMNLLGHEFFVFRNDQTEEICVVYKRHDGDYGLIEDEK